MASYSSIREFLQCRYGCSHIDRISVVRPDMHGPLRDKAVHQIRSARQRSKAGIHWRSVWRSDEVRGEPEMLLGSARGQPKPGDDFIENQDRTCLDASGTSAFEVPGPGRDCAPEL